jgi:uracil-DNA glycosylase family 4
VQLQSPLMDVRKIVRQHKEMEEFFSGGFAVRGESRNRVSQEATQQEDVKEVELTKIADEIRTCCCCGLGKTRKNAVPGEGNPNAQIVFVGEAPGGDEDEQGRPFVGRAGHLLDKIIAAMGLQRCDVFICNVLKCRPPENRDPRPDEIVSCIHFLERQLEIIRPEIIVALGAHAAQTLLKRPDPIGQLRGKFLSYYTPSGYGPIKLMSTYHPAFLLRSYSEDNRRRVWEDMQKVLRELGLPIPSGTKSK